MREHMLEIFTQFSIFRLLDMIKIVDQSAWTIGKSPVVCGDLVMCGGFGFFPVVCGGLR